MKINYDKITDSIYIPLKKGKYSYSKKVTDDVVVDVSKSGNVIGIEILDASKTISGFQPEEAVISFSRSRQPSFA